MPDTIKDGSTGNTVKINARNQLYTKSTIISNTYESTKDGNGYNINTGIINLTNSVETPILYIKNNETKNLQIMAIIVGTWESRGGSGFDGVPKLTVIRNPNGGTIITSTPTDIDVISNRNFGSNNMLNFLAYKGSTGDTMTGGEEHIILQMGVSGRTVVNINEVIPQGASIGVKYTPQLSNISQKIYVAMLCHLEDPKS